MTDAVNEGEAQGFAPLPMSEFQDLMKEWERIVKGGREASAADPEGFARFINRMFEALPDLAHTFELHGDMCRAIHFLSVGGFDINIQFKGSYAECARDLAKGYILLARHHGWKPPRECD